MPTSNIQPMSQQPAARTVQVPRGALVLVAHEIVDDIYGDVGRPQGAVSIQVMPSWDAPERSIYLPLDWESFDHEELLAHMHSQPQLTTLLREVATV
jgi:hypothetical protein